LYDILLLGFFVLFSIHVIFTKPPLLSSPSLLHDVDTTSFEKEGFMTTPFLPFLTNLDTEKGDSFPCIHSSLFWTGAPKLC